MNVVRSMIVVTIVAAALAVTFFESGPVVAQVEARRESKMLALPTKVEESEEGALRNMCECVVAYVDAGPIKVGIGRDTAIGKLAEALKHAGVVVQSDRQADKLRQRDGRCLPTVLVSLEASQGGSTDGHALYRITVSVIDKAVLPRDASRLYQVVSYQQSFLGISPISTLETAATFQMAPLLRIFGEACLAAKK